MTDPSAPQPTPASTGHASAADWLRLFRPRQWSKNAFVLAPLLFSGRATDADAVKAAILAFLAFCLAASAVYAFNDARDSHEDRAHPVKRQRPVAAGRISTTHATWASVLLAAAGLAIAWTTAPLTGLWIGTYLVLNLAYSLGLKHVVLLDVFSIASFFVLRLLAGAAAVAVHPSVWLLLCGGLLALYLGFAKRRHELGVLGAIPPAIGRCSPIIPPPSWTRSRRCSWRSRSSPT